MIKNDKATTLEPLLRLKILSKFAKALMQAETESVFDKIV